jgi:hypothetical protein
VDWKPCEFIKDFTGTMFPQQPPRYLQDLNAWHSDVWPKVEACGIDFEHHFADALDDYLESLGVPFWTFNASAKTRCLALYRALEGKLP